MNGAKLKSDILALGAGEILADKATSTALEHYQLATKDLHDHLARIAHERDGWKKQAEDLSSQIAQHLPSLDAIQRANKRAEEAEARAKEAEAEHSKATHEAARMVASATKDLLAEKQFRAADYASFNKQIEETKNKLEASLADADKLNKHLSNACRDYQYGQQQAETRATEYAATITDLRRERDELSARVPQRLGLHFSGETLPLSVLEGVVAIFGMGALIDIDGQAFVVGDARLSSPALHTWLLSVPLEVSDE